MRQLIQDIRTGKALVIEAPVPCIERGQVLIEVAASVVSPGTERSVVSFGEKNLISKALSRPDLVRQVIAKLMRDGIINTVSAVQQQLAEPMALGYAVSGLIREVGEGVSDFKPGDRVAAAGGGYAVHAEVVAVPTNLVVPIPDNVDYESAAFTTLGAVALQGVRLAEIVIGETVGVIGLGLLGLMTVQQLRAAGCRVFGIDPKSDRAARAAECGAHGTATTSDEFIQLCTTSTHGRGIDAVLITADTNRNDPVKLAGQIARDRASVVVVGAVGMTLPRKPYYQKELQFRVSRSYGPGRYDLEYEEKGRDYPIGYVRWTEKRNMEAVVDLLAEGKMNPRALITHRIPIEDGVKAYEVIKGNSPEPSLGVLLTYPLLEAKSSTREKTIALEPSHQGSGAIAIGLVGAGKFAKGVLMPFIKCDSRVQLIGLCSRTGKSARLSGDKFGFQYCSTDWNRIIGDNQVNTVVITTRHHLHAEQVSAALRAGKHVFVEKPLCVNSTELDAVSEAYRAASERNPAPLLMIDFNRRFASMSLAIKKFMAAVSEPLLIHYRINGGRIPLEHWTQDPAQGGGRLVGEMVHFIDWAIWLANDPPMSVYAVCLPNLGTYNDDNVALTIRFLNGTVAQITYLANGSRAIGKERIEVHGGGKSIILDDFGLLELADESGCHRKRALLKRDKGHGTAWKRFADAIQRGDEAPIAFDQIHTTMRTAFAALQSIREKRELSLEHIG